MSARESRPNSTSVPSADEPCRRGPRATSGSGELRPGATFVGWGTWTPPWRIGLIARWAQAVREPVRGYVDEAGLVRESAA